MSAGIRAGRPRLLVLGAGGQVGSAVAAAAPGAGFDVTALTRAQCDVADAGAVAAAVAGSGALLAVNAAAYPAVDRAEREPGPLAAANVEGPAALAAACAGSGTALLHLSTDYVFGDGAGPWREDDPPAPLSAYGRSKEAGEAAVRARLERHVILRTSGVFAPGGRNFVAAIMAAAASRERLAVVDDQVTCPTAAADLAAAILAIASRLAESGSLPWGTYHYRGAPQSSWHGVAAAILAELQARGRRAPPLDAIASAAYGAPARRPSCSVLDCRRIEAAFGLRPAPWRPALAAMVAGGA
ncbi:MAG: dTDP-4-dehydrorhamnose reductase [Dongiaceae bacterium]